MQSSYILRLKENKIFCFYYTNEDGIVYRVYENNKWSRPKTILESGRQTFTVTAAEDGSIYLFCQDIDGDIFFCIYKGEEWSSRVIIKNQNSKVYTVLLNVIIHKKGLSLIYNSIGNEEKSNYLVIQNLDEKGQWSPSSRIDKFVTMNSYMYQVQHVSEEHLLLFYQTRTGENNLGYREITSSKQGNYNVFHTTNYQITDTSFLTTPSCIHVLYIVKSMFSYQLIYRKKDTEQFSNPIIIWESQRLENCLLMIIKGNLYITFVNNGQLSVCYSEDRGRTFSRVQRYKNKVCQNLVKSIYLSQAAESEDLLYVKEVYTDFSVPWDIQLMPDLYEDFYPITFQAVAKAEIKKEQPTEYINYDEQIFNLSNQLTISQKLNMEKDEKIVNFAAQLKAKNKEIDEAEQLKRSLYTKYLDEKELLEARIKQLEHELLNTKTKPMEKEEPKREIIKDNFVKEEPIHEEVIKEEPKYEEPAKEEIPNPQLMNFYEAENEEEDDEPIPISELED